MEIASYMLSDHHAMLLTTAKSVLYKREWLGLGLKLAQSTDWTHR